MKIFIINLKNKKDNYKRTINQLKKTNLEANNIYRYNALDGKKVNLWNENINLFCKLFCTKKIIGCGLSHIMLYKKLQKFDDEYFLILEDDIKIMPEIDYKKKIDNILNKFNNIDKKWDVINLNNQGFFCKTYKKMQYFCGSSASYLISKNGVKKFSNLKLGYHIDFNRNSKIFNSYVGPDLFRTFEYISKFKMLNYEIGNKSIIYWFNQHIFRAPILNVEINLFLFTILLFVLTNLSIYFIIKYKNYLLFNVIISIFSFYISFFIYNIKEIGYYKISNISHIITFIFLVIHFIYLKFIYSNSFNFYILFFISFCILNFHLLYHFDKQIEFFNNLLKNI